MGEREAIRLGIEKGCERGRWRRDREQWEERELCCDIDLVVKLALSEKA